MKVNRTKRVRKKFRLYINSFGFREPYQVLIDGTFCQAALEAKVHLKEALPALLGGQVQLLSTRCVFNELEVLGEELLGAKLVVKRLQYRSCGHKKPVLACDCLRSLIGSANKQRYCVATQDPALKAQLEAIPGTPVLTISFGRIVIEKPSTATLAAIDKFGSDKLKAPEEAVRLARAAVKEEGSVQKRKRPSRKRKARGPNPLAVRKKKKRAAPPAAPRVAVSA